MSLHSDQHIQKGGSTRTEDGERSGIYEPQGTGEAGQGFGKTDEEGGSRAEFRGGSRAAG